MKYKYKRHPGQYELGENEKFYSDMEAKGWRLVKRGPYRSKFESVEPSQARYRIEVFSQGLMDQAAAPGMPEEQLAVFADCGWEHVCTSLPLYIFRAPAGSDAPEFYMDPAQQAETLKRMKRDAIWGWSPTLVWLAVYWGLNALIGGGAKTGGELRTRFVQLTAFFLTIGAFALREVYQRTRDAWIITRTYRRLKAGVPLDHEPRKKRLLVHRTVSAVLTSLTVLCLLLTAAQLIGTRSTDLPEAAEDPYLLLSDLGWEGERTSFMNRDSCVTHTRSLLADYWDVREYLEETPGRAEHQMYQDVYRLRDPDMAYWLADALMNTATFGKASDFAPIQAEGLDAAWSNHRMEVVAVKGDLVIYVTYLAGSSRDFDPQEIRQALAAAWAS